jgi:cyclic pyranopterin phosphate synthase
MNGPEDTFHRVINYLRISITDRCNLRCVYCMPLHGIEPIRHKEILRYEEIARVLKIAVHKGVRRIRITGGEPLVRKNVSRLIRMIKDIGPVHDLSLTTNGILLAQQADELADAGLDRVNISLDSLRSDRYREITRGGSLDAVFEGIKAAVKAGLSPIKINMVPVRGLNADEIKDFARMTLKEPYQIRFIEFMPFGNNALWSPERFMSAEEIRAVAEEMGILSPVILKKAGPARYFRFEGAAGVIGFITPLSNHFCTECNRLRLTADGKLRPCLFSETEIDLKPALRGNAPDEEIERLFNLSVEIKPKGHTLSIQHDRLRSITDVKQGCGRPMSKIGG